MKKNIIIILSFIPFFAVSQSKEFILTSKTPANVVKAIFYAAKTQEFQTLSELCDPEGKGDGDTRMICDLAYSDEERENFVKFFKNGKISGSTIQTDGGGASVPILYGPNGEKEETMNLIKRDGKWYLSSF